MHVQPPNQNWSQLNPQEQLAVSLYLKSMNKAQAARDAGYSTTSVFDKPHVQAEIAEQMRTRAERLRIGADWVLSELKKCYDTSVAMCDMKGCLKALELIGKHTDIQAWSAPAIEQNPESSQVQILLRGRKRAFQVESAKITVEAEEVIPEPDLPPVCFMGEPDPVVVESLSPKAQSLLNRLRE